MHAVTFAELFAAQVKRTPTATALIQGDVQFSYQELGDWVTRVAGMLTAAGVGPEVLVGIHLGRSPELIAALLGVFAAGGAYLPLDPGYPQERLHFMVEDAGPAVVLCDRDAASALVPLPGAGKAQAFRRIFMEEVDDFPHADEPESVAVNRSAADLAYVIYTSGSTGIPKGVQIEQRGLANLALQQASFFGLGPGDRVLQFAPFSFDAFVWELAMALTVGATLVLPPPGMTLAGGGLLRLLGDASINAVTLPPSVLAVLPVAPLPALGLLIVAGEPCPIELFRRWQSGRRFVNAYGPSECTVCATWYECRGDERELPIGYPFGSVQVHVLDARLVPIPDGEVGELYIGGVGVARGYHRRPRLTEERFLADRSGRSPAGLYRTGDRVRRNEDGSLSFLGRIDNQIKVRGFRVEPEEVEAVLQQHPAVVAAAVVGQEDGRGRVLVAYLTLACSCPSTRLREFMLEQVPGYMVPSRFVVLDALPCTPSGKIDRHGLRDRPLDDSEPHAAFETELAREWARVLGVRRAGPDDDFLLSGGDSLRGVELLAWIHEAFGVELTLADLFESSTISGLSERIQAAPHVRPSGDTGTAVPVDDVPAVGEGQRQLWLLSRLAPERPLYNQAFTLHIDGSLNVAALERAVDAFAQRHVVLRARYPAVSGYPEVRFDAHNRMVMAHVDLRDLPFEQRDGQAEHIARAQLCRPFELEEGPLWRATLLRLGPTYARLEVAIHHIVVDATSIRRVLVEELQALYHAFDRGAESPFTREAPDYFAFVRRQQDRLLGQHLAVQRSYWLDRLSGLAPLRLPWDHPRPPEPSFRGARHHFVLPSSLGGAIAGVAAKSGVTLFMALLAGFVVLLRRYSAQEDIAVATVAELRDEPQWQSLFGYCINTLVLRNDLSGDPSFREVLARVRAVALGAFAHKTLPFSRVVELLGPRRQAGLNPFAQVAFTLEPFPSGAGTWRIDTDTLHNGTAQFDLSLTFCRTAEGLNGFFEYDSALFDTDTVVRMVGHLRTLFESAVADPAQRVSQLHLLTPEEWRQIEKWNRTDNDGPRECSFEMLFEAQARQTPDAIALTCGEGAVTYRELNRRADCLARYLTSRGAGPEIRIGVCLRRSPEMITAVLAVMKSGGAYVPLDPGYPRERLRWMLNDAQPKLLLVDGETLQALPRSEGVVPVVLDGDWETLDSVDTRNERAAAGDLAYVLYTSGSSGEPKGVMVERRGLANLAFAMRRRFELGPGDTILQFASLSFDASVWELAMALTCGATLHLPAQDVPLVGKGLENELTARGITAVTLPPTVLATLSVALPKLRLLVVAGEACPPAIVARWAPGRRFVNAYGPTEATVCATWAECTGMEAVPPIGFPLDNVQTYVLDPAGQPAPVGVAGELFVGGVGLARGYLRRPDLTTTCFVPNPFGSWPPRLYRTGDKARWRRDGALEFLGRCDTQLKINGIRIEPREIEIVLRRHPQVTDAIVVPHGKRVGSSLVAYVLANGEASRAEAWLGNELNDYLEELLPRHLVPTAIVVMDRFPVTVNGKVDRAALPNPYRRRDEGASMDAPLSGAYRLVAAIWCRVLKLDEVRITDNFFDLGGSSILLIEVQKALWERLGIEVPLVTLFRYTTAKALADYLERRRGADASSWDSDGARRARLRKRALGKRRG